LGPSTPYRNIYLWFAVGQQSHRKALPFGFVSQRGYRAHSILKFFVLFCEAIYIQDKEEAEAGGALIMSGLELAMGGTGLPMDSLEGVIVTVFAGSCYPADILIEAPWAYFFPKEGS
jgi:hypothetical protein